MLQRDEDILKLVSGSTEAPPILSNFQIPAPPFGKQSSIQPSSLDLKIGTIYLPDAPEDGEGGIGNGAIEHWLEPGNTAVVITRESVHLPSHIAGFGFPPTSISSNAILMTNPGHIDPGYNGHLSFTVINMGKRPFCLRQGDTIVTCLLVNLGQPVKLDYTQQGHPTTGPLPSRSGIARLSRDFLNFSSRSTEIANQVSTQRLEEIRIQNRRRDTGAIIIGLVALLLALLPLYLSFLPPILELNKVSSEVKISERLKSLENKLEKIDKQIQSAGRATQ